MKPVDTSHYRSDHGRSPKQNETGGWSFSDKKFGKEFYMSPNKMPYKDAKAEAQKIAKEKGFSKIYLAASYHPEFADDNVQLDESRDDFDYLDIEAAMQDAKLEAPKVVKTRKGYQVMVYSRKVKKFIPQGPPHRSKAAAEKDAKMFEDVQIDETNFRFPQPGEDYGDLAKSISDDPYYTMSKAELKKRSDEVDRKFEAVMRKHKRTKVGEVLDLLDKDGGTRLYKRW